MSIAVTFRAAQVFGIEIVARIASTVRLDKARVEKTLYAGAPALLAALRFFSSKPGRAEVPISPQEPGTLSTSISRIRQLELELAHLNRLNVIGELTASLAHEILHPIATARTNAQVGVRLLGMNSAESG